MKFILKWQVCLRIGIVFTTILGVWTFIIRQQHYRALGVLFWAGILLICYYMRPRSALHGILLDDLHKKGRVSICLICFLEILICTLPMGISPTWNGESAGHRNQYEIMAESILHGHIYMDYDDIDPKLEEMENPYDPVARQELGVVCHDDHAYYKGHYYMYFGIVPVVVLFLPFRILTGSALVTYRATQIFVAFAIIGFYMLFRIISKVLFSKITAVMYILLSTALSATSIWYSIGSPALYSTAITSGICMEIWSLYFFVKAVWIEEKENRQILYAFIGAGFGALTFGCRPPIGLVNLLVIPLLVMYLRRKSMSMKLLGKLVLAAMPYIVIGILLALYNYKRFGNLFEFGQSYQLTVADQHNYSDFGERFSWYNLVSKIKENFISFRPLTKEFPFISYGGVLVNFPIFMLTVCGLTQEAVCRKIKAIRIIPFLIALGVIPVVITAVDIMWSPYIFERYRMDIYFQMGILCFIVISLWYMETCPTHQRAFSSIIAYLSVATMMKCFLLWTVPFDGNPTKYYPELLERIENVVLFWKI